MPIKEKLKTFVCSPKAPLSPRETVIKSDLLSPRRTVQPKPVRTKYHFWKRRKFYDETAEEAANKPEMKFSLAERTWVRCKNLKI